MTATEPVATPELEIRLLGEVAVVVGDERRPVVRPREQAVLARLALAAPHQVPIRVLVDDVWGADPPPTAVDALRVHVSNVRKLLAGGRRAPGEVLVTVPGAYRFDLSSAVIDVLHLEEACRAQDVDSLRPFLGSWDGHDLARFETGSGFFAASAQHTANLFMDGAEIVSVDDLAAGRAGQAVDRLENVLRGQPHRERAWELLVRSLDALGRRTEALRAGQRARETLAEVGIEPGRGLVSAEKDVLADESSTAALERPSGDYVDVDGSRIAYATIGGGPHDLLFLHGGFVPFSVMPDEPRLARFLQRLAETFRLVLVDRRGIGMSDPPADGSAVSLDHWVADCRAVLDAVGAQRALVFAHENAGPVALRLAAEDPERIRGLVLHSTAARPLRAPDHPYGPTPDVYEWVGRMLDRQLGEDEMLRTVAPSVGDDPALRSWLDRAGRLGAGPTRAAELHRTYLDSDVRDVLAEVHAPTIVLQPARRIRSDPGQARHLADQLPDAELQILDSADHLPWLADADTVISAVHRLHERTSTAARGAPVVLRALVAVSPPCGADLLLGRGAERCLQVPGAVVATFTSRSRAEDAVSALRSVHPDSSTCIEVADTDATPDDPAVRSVAARAQSGASPS